MMPTEATASPSVVRTLAVRQTGTRGQCWSAESIQGPCQSTVGRRQRHQATAGHDANDGTGEGMMGDDTMLTL